MIPPMKSSILKLLNLALIPIFFLTFSTSALSFSWCVGEDGHSEVVSTANNDCCNDVVSAQPGANLPLVSKHVIENVNCGPCLDVGTSNYPAVTKRLKNEASSKEIIRCAYETSLSACKDKKNYLSKLVHNQPLRVSQTILIHRKVVLLN